MKSPANPEETFAKWVHDNPFTAIDCGAAWALREIKRLRLLFTAAADRIAAQSELLSQNAERNPTDKGGIV